MRSIFLILWTFLPIMSGFAQSPPLRIMSFNLRLNVESDGENAWPNRTELVESMIRFHTPDIIGVQEALEGQKNELIQMFPDYRVGGVPRDTGDWAEYSAIMWRKSRLKTQGLSTFWLSETPDSMSRGWDAALNRIVTWARFEDRQTGERFWFFNTHFDHRGQVARRESARLLLQKIQEMNTEGLPVIVTGDFNATPDSEPYRILTQSEEFPPLQDAWNHSLRPPHGPASTWSGFETAGVPNRRIDYVFFQNQVAVHKIASLTDSWSGRFPSDHLPVLAEVWINPNQALPQAHAHNDYEHPQPLFDALAHGFTSIEVDIWHHNGQLYVSHDRPLNWSTTPNLNHLYLYPLSSWVDAQGGRVYPGHDGPLWLMIDLKNQGEESYRMLKGFLKVHRQLFIGENPAVRVFLSGARSVEQIHLDPERMVGIDGRPDDLGKGYTAEEMPFISQSFRRYSTWNGEGDMPADQQTAIRELAEACHAEGKKLRLWATPETENAWETFLELGVDLLNTDDLERLEAFLSRGSR